MYEDFYGINAKPFQLSPDPKFFFPSPKHREALSYLEYGLDQAEGFIVITGPIGTGKTTLAQNLLNRIQGAHIEAVQIVSSNLSPTDLLSFVAKEFGLKPELNTKASILEAIEQHLNHVHQQGKRCLLIVDEAQNLPIDTVEELRMLSNFQHNNKPLLQSFLLGQEELKTHLQTPEMEQFRQRIIASCHLKPLTTEEIEQYIGHRLTTVGLESPNIFDPQCFQLIQQITRGVPRKINLLADRIMLYGFLNDLQHFTAETVQKVINEMKLELTASLNQLEPNIQTTRTPEQPNDKSILNTSHNISTALTKIDDFLTEALEPKIKMNRYLDKLIKLKNLTISEDDKS
ncbi:XrtA/PEP-CTERM system-associated ATPase [Thalassotalea aquiviva]|uniref:XrtA/PEP-CTERM system-associated ATPase n=1 Tax=Thalassotalea aquiviva TaxID=3242415 RepID=UPI00352BBB23